MTNEEIAKASEKMEMKIKMRDKNPYMSTHWFYFDGQALGIESLMSELGYKWNGSKFVAARYDEKEGENDERD